MRNKAQLVAAFLTLAALLAACTAGTTTPSAPSGTTTETVPSAITVSMKGLAFVPDTVEIAAGESITFVNDDTVQHVVAGDQWQSGTIDPGESYTQAFTVAGANPIRCTIHPSMTGTVNVE